MAVSRNYEKGESFAWQMKQSQSTKSSGSVKDEELKTQNYSKSKHEKHCSVSVTRSLIITNLHSSFKAYVSLIYIS